MEALGDIVSKGKSSNGLRLNPKKGCVAVWKFLSGQKEVKKIRIRVDWSEAMGCKRCGNRGKCSVRSRSETGPSAYKDIEITPMSITFARKVGTLGPVFLFFSAACAAPRRNCLLVHSKSDNKDIRHLRHRSRLLQSEIQHLDQPFNWSFKLTWLSLETFGKT